MAFRSHTNGIGSRYANKAFNWPYSRNSETRQDGAKLRKILLKRAVGILESASE